jgi:hypothetical protein
MDLLLYFLDLSISIHLHLSIFLCLALLYVFVSSNRTASHSDRSIAHPVCHRPHGVDRARTRHDLRRPSEGRRSIRAARRSRVAACAGIRVLVLSISVRSVGISSVIGSGTAKGRGDDRKAAPRETALQAERRRPIEALSASRPNQSTGADMLCIKHCSLLICMEMLHVYYDN